MENILLVGTKDDKLHFVFFPSEERIGRPEFLLFFNKCMLQFLEEIEGGNAFITIIREMIKNIYDHADCSGSAVFIKTGRFVYFRIEDSGEKSFDYAALTWNSSKRGNGVNSGKGLGSIIDMCHNVELSDTPDERLCNLDLGIDCSSGFS